MKIKKSKHLGAYGLIIKEEKILLVKKYGGPYNSKLDLPGGKIEFGESPESALKRELMEEVGIECIEYKLFDADSVTLKWQFKEDILEEVHHIGIFFKILNYSNEIKKEVKIDDKNDDSLGADFFDIKELSKDRLSNIAILELEKLGYKLKS